MNSITREIYVTRQTLPNPIEYVQGTNALPIVFTFADYNIPEETAAKVYVEKPSGHCQYDLAAIADNTVTVDVKDTMFDEVGTSNLQIKLTKDDKTLITFDYPVRVSKNRVAGNVPQSGDNSDLIDDLLARGEPAVEAAEAAADRANAAADRVDGTDVGALTKELDDHTGSQVNTSNGVHGMSIDDGQLYIGSLGRWNKAIDRTYANPRMLPDSSDLSRVSEPGVYAGKSPAGALSENTQYILVVSKAGDGLISRSVTFPLEDKRYTYSVTNMKWVQPRDVVEEGDSGTLHYIKYSDGSMTVEGEQQKTVAFSSTAGNIWVASKIEIDTGIPTPENALITVADTWAWCNYSGRSLSKIQFSVIIPSASSPGERTFNFRIMAFGRWK